MAGEVVDQQPTNVQLTMAHKASAKPRDLGKEKALPSFQCPDCSLQFSRKEYVKRHRRLKHLGSRPFPCEGCDKAFARSDLLKRHQGICKGKRSPSRSKQDDRIDAGETGFNPSVLGLASLFPTGFLDEFPLSLPVIVENAATSSSSSSASRSCESTTPPSSIELSKSPSTSSSIPSFSPPQLSPQVPADEPLPDISIDHTFWSWNDDTSFSEIPRQTTLYSTQDTPSSADVSSASLPEISSSSESNVGQSYSQRAGNGELEFTQEAQALADYFNKGGVGGITALDLGFSYEPSLYPSWLTETTESMYESTNDERFFMPRDKFAFTYLMDSEAPPLSTMTHLAETAADKFLPQVPIMHSPTLSLSKGHIAPSYALSVVGSSISKEERDEERELGREVSPFEVGEEKLSEMLAQKRFFILKLFGSHFVKFADKFAGLQSFLLYQLLGLFHKDAGEREVSRNFHGSLVMMFKTIDLPAKINESDLPEIHSALSGTELEIVWKRWIEVETWRRVAFTVHLCDLETTAFASPSTELLIPVSSLSIHLPASDCLWNAPNADSWLQLYISPNTARPLLFLDAISALLEEGAPTKSSSTGLILDGLKLMSSFPLLILSRTMAYLEKSKEAEVLSGTRSLFSRGVDEDKLARECGKELKRVKRGREKLAGLPGSLVRGGGEGWYRGVKPVIDKGQAILKAAGLEETVMNAAPTSASCRQLQVEEWRKLCQDAAARGADISCD